MSQQNGFEPTTIPDRAVPLLSGVFSASSGSASDDVSGDMPTPDEISNPQIPQGFVASQVISSTLDTETRKIKGAFTFEQLGAIQIGQILISPTGVLATDSGGNTTFAINPDTGSVTMKGTLTSGSVVTGYIAVGGAAGDVNGGSTTIDGGKLTTGTVTADTVRSNWVYAGNISAGQINAGTLSANYISGGTIDASSINVTNLNASHISSGTVSAGYIDTNSFSNMYVSTGIKIGGGAASVNGLTINGSFHAAQSSQVVMDNDLGMNNHNINSCNTFYFSDGKKFTSNGGDKSAIVPVKDEYRALYCIEAPEVWFMDFCGEDKKIDPMFLEVTEGLMHFIKTEDGYQVWRKRKGHGDKRFELKTREEFEANERFLGMSKPIGI